MAGIDSGQRRSGRVISGVLFLAWGAATLYFAYHAVEGGSGLFRRMELEARQADLASRLAALEHERDDLANHVRRLSDDHLDLELLDERARAVLGLVRGDEIIIR